MVIRIDMNNAPAQRRPAPAPRPAPAQAPAPAPAPETPIQRHGVGRLLRRIALAAAVGAGAMGVKSLLPDEKPDNSHLRAGTHQQAAPQQDPAPRQDTTLRTGNLSALLRDPLVYGHQQPAPAAQQQVVYRQAAAYQEPAPAPVAEMRLTGQPIIVLMDAADPSKTTAIELYFQNNAGGKTGGFTKTAGPGIPATIHLLATAERHKPGTALRLDCERGGDTRIRAGKGHPETYILTPDKDTMFLMFDKGKIRELTTNDLQKMPAWQDSALNAIDQLPNESRNNFAIETAWVETTHKYVRDDGR
ncbi:MAG: hypothetical protein PHX68_02405 [Alphaproteobacteria bacterium]|nr:hypothetical protein [Alphaproteobacteria bacterium]